MREDSSSLVQYWSKLRAWLVCRLSGDRVAPAKGKYLFTKIDGEAAWSISIYIVFTPFITYIFYISARR